MMMTTAMWCKRWLPRINAQEERAMAATRQKKLKGIKMNSHYHTHRTHIFCIVTNCLQYRSPWLYILMVYTQWSVGSDKYQNGKKKRRKKCPSNKTHGEKKILNTKRKKILLLLFGSYDEFGVQMSSAHRIFLYTPRIQYEE